ncbi:DUF4398 domain-containing protein [Chondromyces crocatus]|nr:DUF4398 domain-containing protein [Chondromyces crocatus]
MTETKSAIGLAEEAGAAQSERAALHLRMAREQLYQARKLLEEGDDKQATAVLRHAKQDAQRSLQIARAQREQEQWDLKQAPQSKPVMGQQGR